MEQSAITIEKVSYGITIGNNNFGNSRPGVVEATLKAGKTLEEALDELDDRLNAWHRKKYPHLYGPELPPFRTMSTGAALEEQKEREQATSYKRLRS